MCVRAELCHRCMGSATVHSRSHVQALPVMSPSSIAGHISKLPLPHVGREGATEGTARTEVGAHKAGDDCPAAVVP